jgi:hypothetical protein
MNGRHSYRTEERRTELGAQTHSTKTSPAKNPDFCTGETQRASRAAVAVEMALVCIATTHIQTTLSEQRYGMMLKLYHRTSFWGKDLHGYKVRGHKLPIIQVQAIVNDEDTDSFGCCRHHGRRCVEIDESHFIANDRDDWSLYHVKTLLGEDSEHGDYYHNFALIPKSKASTQNIGKGWTLLGIIQPCAARMDLAPFLRPFLMRNGNFEHTYAIHHAHIALAMNMVTVDERRHERRPELRKGKQQHNFRVNVCWEKPEEGMPLYARDNAQQENGTVQGEDKKLGARMPSLDSRNANQQENGTTQGKSLKEFT